MNAITFVEPHALGKRRNGYEVVRDILAIALNGSSATQIVYGANLTFPRFKKHSIFLVSKGLLAADHSQDCLRRYKVYKTTEKGKRLLRILSQASELV